MGPTKIMIIRHAEKPGTYANTNYLGIDSLGNQDPESLVTIGWQRAGAIANLFCPSNAVFQNPALVKPDFIYAADPALKKDHEPSQRPYQTIQALSAKMGLSSSNLNTAFKKNDFAAMVTSVLGASGVVLISWQHQDILPKAPGDDSIVSQLLQQTDTPPGLPIPAGPWPGERYDMVLVLDRPTGVGPFTAFTQVPQLLLAGDLALPFAV